MTALRALRDSRTDVEALDITADRLRHLQDVFTKAGEAARTRAARATRGARRTAPDDADTAHPVRQDDQQAHRPQQPGPRRGREAGR
ncbi:hypothetical protein [Streptomyces koyangensis]|uniref:hypothetical protein n=1 Tax=Streptomyces koyangensis TaxID=188770 RepID=UPI003C2AE05A